MDRFEGTTIVSIRGKSSVVIGGDGQVTMGDTIMKGNAKKVRRLYKDLVLAGFAGGTADGFTLVEILIVVVIVGILAAIAIPTYYNYVKKGYATEAKTQIKTFNLYSSSLEMLVVQKCNKIFI